ncbi:glycosyltransferase family 2 protein [Alkalihalophilus lindianensis]|uniref:Glycosyltransferase family 2 protein n=1 Tax=Alkalihalophilus lindianensis TaxID=1630542 RepID=A0ABU3XB39_9BACI|nr:glycosyltransferase family 2 protein [Alkalihalophilus lindianensis]MDV2685099.1 glycosyltransferase family 2 protein [Alkalihalophilus lindianensis]
MVTISLCMIVKNEELLLARCLDSVVDLVDEINIIDTGSTDNTVQIAKEYTNRVFFYKWNGDFAAARNASFDHATKDYILYLDADDVIEKKDQLKLNKLKETLDPSVDSVSMYYHAGLDNYGNVTLKYRRNRLVKRTRNFKWCGDVHNYLKVHGTIIHSDVAITHKKEKHSVSRNLDIYQKKIERGDTFSARDHFYYGNELRENKKFNRAIKAYESNIASEDGWSEDKFFSCIFKADCFKMLEQPEEERKALIESLQFSKKIRPEMSCRLGDYYLRKKDYASAIVWYNESLSIRTDSNQWSFSFPAYSSWYPHLQLCVCYYKLKQYQQAFDHNKKASIYLPDHPKVIYNHELLARIIE